MKLRVGVIFGGVTVEHEVSIISAIQAIEHMNKEKYDIIPIYIAKDNTWYTGDMLKEIDSYQDMTLIKKYAKKVSLIRKNDQFFLQKVDGLLKGFVNEIDIVFPIVHGNNVEDGTIQGYLEAIGIPYVGSKILGGALGQDKVVMKQVMDNYDIPLVKYTWFYDYEYYQEKDNILKKIKEIKYPVIVKPAKLGSSVGIEIAYSEDTIEDAINEAMKYDNKIVVEEVIENLEEFNCSVLGNYQFQETSAIDQIITNHNLLTYNDKYSGSKKGKGMASSNRILPAKIDSKLQSSIEEISKKAFKALNLSGVVRIDFLYDSKKNHLYVNEPNTIPGSLSFYLWEAKGKNYEELLDELITFAIKDFKEKSKKTYSFETNILNNFRGTKGLKGLKK